MTPPDPAPPRNRPALWGGFVGSLAATPLAVSLACITAAPTYVIAEPPSIGVFLQIQGWVCVALSNLLTLVPFGLLPGWIVGRRQAEDRIAFTVSGATAFLCTGIAAYLLWRFFLFAASQ